MDSGGFRRRLVATLRERGALHDEAVERAFLTVPRELFLPGLAIDDVYRDEAILTKIEDGVGVSSSSQPAIMSLMLEQLDLFPGARVLEIGAGTGYNAALLRELAGASGEIITVDIDPEIAGWATERLQSAGYTDVLIRCADGADGWPKRAPYDRIELTVGADDISPAWHEQLVEGGVLVLPFWVRTGQISVAFERRDGAFYSRSVQPCGFMPLRGRMAATARVVEVADGVVAAIGDDDAAKQVRGLLRDPTGSTPWEARAWDGFSFFVGLWDLPVFNVWAGAEKNAMIRGFGYALFDRESASLAIVAAMPGDPTPSLLAFGGMAAAERLRSAFDHWIGLGRPDVDELDLAAFPLLDAPLPEAGMLVVDTQLWRLAFSRRSGPIQ